MKPQQVLATCWGFSLKAAFALPTGNTPRPYYYGLLLASIAQGDATREYLCLLGIASCLAAVYEIMGYLAARPYTFGEDGRTARASAP